MRKGIILLAAIVAFAVTGHTQVQNAPGGATPSQQPGYYPVGPNPGYGGPPEIKSYAPPFMNSPEAIAAGRRLFVWYNCYGCHGGHAGGGMGPNLRDSKYFKFGGTSADIFNTIAAGRDHGMPAWGLKIPNDQIWQIVAYIQSLGTPKEPDPPK